MPAKETPAKLPEHKSNVVTGNKRSNREWLQGLRGSEDYRNAALADLRKIILAGLPFALAKWLPVSDPNFDALIEEVAQETLLRVMDKLTSFEGRSHFTTWVHKIAVRIALNHLRQSRWREISLNNLLEDGQEDSSDYFLVDRALEPDVLAERKDIYAQIHRLIMNELTEKQRRIMVAVAIKGMPLEEVARQLGMERNALYKVMHDARLRLKARMAADGLAFEEVMAMFDH